MSIKITPLNAYGFLAFEQKRPFLISELQERFGITKDVLARAKNYGDLILINKKDFTRTEQELKMPNGAPFWAKNVLFDSVLINFDSIADGAKALKDIQRSWAPYQYQFFRRASLLQQKLPYINLKERKFPFIIPHTPVGMWTLIDQNSMIASSATSSFLPGGHLTFVEDHVNPPSRAYLKLQEALVQFKSIYGKDLPPDAPLLPNASSNCFDAGACPGGWTWVLVQCGAKVFAVDRTELDKSLMQNNLVRFMAHDAFTLKPQTLIDKMGNFDWVFSDVICYPERLLKWVNEWLSLPTVPNMICTIKMQGDANWSCINDFAQISNSTVLHLNYNKHELTWLHLGSTSFN